MKKRITCPHCHQHYEVEDTEIAGFNEMTCNSCNKDFMIAENIEDVQKEKNLEKPQKNHTIIRKEKKRKNILALSLSLIMFALAIMSFDSGYVESHKYYGFPTDRKNYDYYGDLIPHLNYKATLELLGEVQIAEYFIKFGTRKIQGTLYYLISAVLFSSGCIILVMRQRMLKEQYDIKELQMQLVEAIKELHSKN